MNWNSFLFLGADIFDRAQEAGGIGGSKELVGIETIVPAARGQKLVPSADYIRQKDREPKPDAPDTTPLEAGLIEDESCPF